jgi:hypothetical protein
MDNLRAADITATSVAGKDTYQAFFRSLIDLPIIVFLDLIIKTLDNQKPFVIKLLGIFD